jgi:addiction module HigA family antidote
MQPKSRIPSHPGEILLHEFLEPLGRTQAALVEHLRISVQRIDEIVRGKQEITPDTAWLLAQALGTSPELWLNPPAAHDLARNRASQSVPRFRRAS